MLLGQSGFDPEAVLDKPEAEVAALLAALPQIAGAKAPAAAPVPAQPGVKQKRFVNTRRRKQ